MPFITQGKTNWKYILIVAVFVAIAGAGIFYCRLKFPEAKPLAIRLPPPKGEVTIATDKTEYEEGEMVKIIIQNNFEKGIEFYCQIEKIAEERIAPVRIFSQECPGRAGGLELPIVLPGMPLSAHQAMEFAWDQKDICTEVQQSAGRYRVKADVIIKEYENYTVISEERITIYSEGFTIKEKSEDEIADWKTYRNEEYGFVVDYPAGWLIETKGASQEEVLEVDDPCYNLRQKESEPQKFLYKISFSNPEDKPNEVSLSVFDNTGGLSLQDWVNFRDRFLSQYPECEWMREELSRPIGESQEIAVSGVKGLRGSGGCCDVSAEMVYLAKDKKVYSMIALGSFKTRKQFLDHMLSTFRFID